MNYLYCSDRINFLNLIYKIDLMKFVGTCEHSWRQRCESMIQSEKIDFRDIRGRVLGKLKLIWNYLRTSLPQDFQSRDFLRTKSVGEFFDLYDHLSKDKNSFELSHNTQHDALFAR